MREAILDTDTLSYVLTRRFPEVDKAAEAYLHAFGALTVSAITIAEVVAGRSGQGDSQSVAKFLTLAQSFVVLELGLEEAGVAGELIGALRHAGTPIGPLDPFIAATAITCDLPLVTNNTRHYQRVIDLGFPLELENWRLA
jgi:tRNA(fMet)-specific endonuclease VapC